MELNGNLSELKDSIGEVLVNITYEMCRRITLSVQHRLRTANTSSICVKSLTYLLIRQRGTPDCFFFHLPVPCVDDGCWDLGTWSHQKWWLPWPLELVWGNAAKFVWKRDVFFKIFWRFWHDIAKWAIECYSFNRTSYLWRKISSSFQRWYVQRSATKIDGVIWMFITGYVFTKPCNYIWADDNGFRGNYS